MNIKLMKDWISDCVDIEVDGEFVGRIATQDMYLVVDTLKTIIDRIAPADYTIYVGEK